MLRRIILSCHRHVRFTISLVALSESEKDGQRALEIKIAKCPTAGWRMCEKKDRFYQFRNCIARDPVGREESKMNDILLRNKM